MSRDEVEALAARFEEQRPRLRGVAYRMLGSLTEADDAVQEAWLRLARSDAHGIDDLRAWLTTVVARVCLDVLRARRTRREGSIDGARVPDPIVSLDEAGHPESEALLADSVGLALLVVLDTLSPAERLAFVLHDVFGVPFEEIAPVVGRSPTATRQLASRGRRRVRSAGTSPGAIPGASARSSPPSWRPLATATSNGCWPCSTRTSSSGSTAARARRRLDARGGSARRRRPRLPLLRQRMERPTGHGEWRPGRHRDAR